MNKTLFLAISVLITSPSAFAEGESDHFQLPMSTLTQCARSVAYEDAYSKRYLHTKDEKVIFVPGVLPSYGTDESKMNSRNNGVFAFTDKTAFFCHVPEIPVTAWTSGDGHSTGKDKERGFYLTGILDKPIRMEYYEAIERNGKPTNEPGFWGVPELGGGIGQYEGHHAKGAGKGFTHKVQCKSHLTKDSKFALLDFIRIHSENLEKKLREKKVAGKKLDEAEIQRMIQQALADCGQIQWVIDNLKGSGGAKQGAPPARSGGTIQGG